MNRKKEKRFLSLLLMLCIVLSILPASAVAASVWRPLAESQDALAERSLRYLRALQDERAGG